ncbi:hypothetical protein CC79DRAFT_169575 [Sarocladium strictum]
MADAASASFNGTEYGSLLFSLSPIPIVHFPTKTASITLSRLPYPYYGLGPTHFSHLNTGTSSPHLSQAKDVAPCHLPRLDFLFSPTTPTTLLCYTRSWAVQSKDGPCGQPIQAQTTNPMLGRCISGPCPISVSVFDSPRNVPTRNQIVCLHQNQRTILNPQADLLALVARGVWLQMSGRSQYLDVCCGRIRFHSAIHSSAGLHAQTSAARLCIPAACAVSSHDR